jgi:hypothetical protein
VHLNDITAFDDLKLCRSMGDCGTRVRGNVRHRCPSFGSCLTDRVFGLALRHLFPVADLPWGIFASRSFIARHGRPAGAGDLVRFTVVELIDTGRALDEYACCRRHR